jgi:hypothetical protein
MDLFGRARFLADLLARERAMYERLIAEKDAMILRLTMEIVELKAPKPHKKASEMAHQVHILPAPDFGTTDYQQELQNVEAYYAKESEADGVQKQ